MIDVILKMILMVVFTILTLNTIHSLLEISFNGRYNVYKSFLPYIYGAYFVLGMSSMLFPMHTIVNMIFHFICILGVTFCYSASLHNRLFISLCIVSFIVGVEIVTPYLFGWIFHQAIGNMLNNEVISMFIMAFVKFIPFLIVQVYKIFRSINRKAIEAGNSIGIRYWVGLFLIPYGSILLITSMFLTFSKRPDIGNSYVNMMILTVLLLNISLYYIYNIVLEASYLRMNPVLLEEQITYYEEQLDTLNKSVEENRMIKHDFKYQLIYLLSNITDNNSTDSVDLVRQKTDKLFNNIFNKEYTCYTNHPALDMLLNYQVNKATPKEIKIDIDADIFDKIDIDGKILCIIVGNALDNAIEVCEQQLEKDIKVKIVQQYANLYIDISNPYDGTVILDKDLPKTKKRDAHLHGFGLKSIKKLVNENNGHLKISTNNNIFRIQILLNVK